MKPTVICIVGPTASGKTGLSVELAKRVNGEIISADSMQIYKGLDIGTAKITDDEAQGIPHHLINICAPSEKFSVADFKQMCYDKIDNIISRGKTPIIVGGTGLYISAIVNDMQFDKQDIDEDYRNHLYSLANEKSNEYVYNMLKEIDNDEAKNIHPNNIKRVIRALEIAKYSGKSKSSHIYEEKSRIQKNDIKYNFIIYAIDHDREKLYERINKRVELMMQEGLLREAILVYDMKLSNDSTCMQAIGYKELFPYITGEDSLENCIEKLKQETRKYAKRQLTWFKNKLSVIWLNPKENKESLIEIITKDL